MNITQAIEIYQVRIFLKYYSSKIEREIYNLKQTLWIFIMTAEEFKVRSLFNSFDEFEAKLFIYLFINKKKQHKAIQVKKKV